MYQTHLLWAAAGVLRRSDDAQVVHPWRSGGAVGALHTMTLLCSAAWPLVMDSLFASIGPRLRRILPYFQPSWRFAVLTLAACMVAAATEPMIPALFKPLLDDGFTPAGFALWLVPVVVVGLFGVRGVAHFVGQYALTRIANDGIQRLRVAQFERMSRADLGLFRTQSASSLSNALVYEVQSGTLLLVGAFTEVLRDGLTVLALLGYLLWLNWQLTMLVLLVVPALAWIMKHLSARLYRLSRESQLATDDLAYVVEENVLAHRMIRLHAAQAGQLGRFAALGERLRRLALKSTVASAAMTPLTQLTASLGLSLVIVVAMLQARDGWVGASVGGFVAFITAMLMLISPMRKLADVVTPMTRGLAALERGLDVLSQVPPEADGGHTSARAQGAIVWADVSLHYAPVPAPTSTAMPDPQAPNEPHPPALDGVSLSVQPGEVVAFVGPSGAGKSTLVQTLARFVLPTQGRILLDGVALGDWSLPDLRRQLAVVSQDVVMLNDSVAANVALGQVPDEARVQACLEAAHLWPHVQQLPQGMHTRLGHNAGQLSGGQRQRLAIARALYKDAPILILDEATSALDNASERLVQDALERLMQGRTTLIVAHRLSTIEHADRVVVMQAGRVVEQGPPAHLLAAGGAYAQLHQRGQLGQAAA